MAEFGAAIVALAAVFLLPAPLGAAALQNAGCPSCIALSITPAAATGLPPQLDGREVFIRLLPGSEPAVIDALMEVERKGGRPALAFAIPGEPVVPAGARARVRRVLLPAGAWQGEDPDLFAFALKRRLTGIRAAIDVTTPLGLAVDARTLTMLMSRDLGSYVDFVVATDPVATPPAAIELWRTLPGTPASVKEVLESTRAPETTHWLWQLPDDPAMAGALARGACESAGAGFRRSPDSGRQPGQVCRGSRCCRRSFPDRRRDCGATSGGGCPAGGGNSNTDRDWHVDAVVRSARVPCPGHDRV